jgi:hypothetical protein
MIYISLFDCARFWDSLDQSGDRLIFDRPSTGLVCFVTVLLTLFLFSVLRVLKFDASAYVYT